MGEFSIMHWAVVAIIMLLFFGPSKLPGLGKSLGEAIRGFKKGISELDAELDQNKPSAPKEISHIPVQELPQKSAQPEKTTTNPDS